MPFTFSHPAAILPLAKYAGRYVSLTGLIVGSVTPDFEYFFWMRFQNKYSHSMPGLFYFDLPVGILLAFVFHNLVRNPLYDHLQAPFRSRLAPYQTFDWNGYFKRYYLTVIVSILIGAASHILWDGFTHRYGYFVQTFPALQARMLLAGYAVSLYNILQHLSGLVGGLLIALAFYRLPASPDLQQTPPSSYWLTVGVIFILTVALRSAFGAEGHFLKVMIPTCFMAFFIGLSLAPMVLPSKINKR